METPGGYLNTILIVDDLAENIEILGTVLRKNNYKVAVAMNGKEAISIAKSVKPDLILLDISMPGMDGLAVCKLLKEESSTDSIPVVFVTAKTESEDIIAGFSTGAVDYITKPYKSAELLMRIKTHLTITRLQKELQKTNARLEQKVIERTLELQTAKEKAETSDKLKSEFLSQISHEIRTPLNAVISSATLIESEMQDNIDEYLKPIFQSLKKGTFRIIRTVDMILNMALIHTHSYELKKEKLDIAELLLITSLKYRSAAKEKGLSFLFNSSLKEAYIHGDYHAVTEIFEHLLDNAINYTKKGFVKVDSTETDDEYAVSVEDSGMGISEDFLSSLFTYFSQEDTGYTRKFDGNGLGLALTKKYCEMHNASISVKSRKNEGSSFTVVFKKYKY